MREEMTALDERLGARPYLVGDRFTTADLTAGCLLVPVLLVSRDEGFGAVLPWLDQLSDEARATVQELRQTRIGRHCLAMFARERRPD